MNICLVHEEYLEETNFSGIATYQKISAKEYVKQNSNVIVGMIFIKLLILINKFKNFQYCDIILEILF